MTLTKKFGLIDNTLVIQKNADYIYVPLTRKPKENELSTLRKQVVDLQIETCTFQEKKKQEKSLLEVLEDQLPPYLLASLPKALDVVGDIAVIDIPSELKAYEKVIGEAVLKTHRSVHTVLAKAGAISGTYRLRKFDVIAGTPKTSTVHKEYGCTYYVDVAKVYFSPRLSYEHYRVASLVQKGEVVVDLFAGVGPFAILMAKKQDAKVYAVDLNADAIELLEKNIRLNRVENRVFPVLGDARHVAETKLLGVADRVIMNLPETAIDFVDAACKAIAATGGIVHFYGFVRLPDTIEKVEQRFSEAVEKAGRKVESFVYAKEVRATAPYEWQIVLDARIR